MNNKGFTLIEILVGILIISIIMIGAFQALTAVSLGKVRLIQSTQVEKQSFYFTEKFFELIKKGGTLDYEEYFNRSVVGNTTYSSGHYDRETGFGNFGVGGSIGTVNYGTGFYYCRSGDGESNKLGSDGCATSGELQRYGQYSFQFIDYNSNYDDDGGDEDGDGDILGDDDDEYTGLGPAVFQNGDNIRELYLISGDKRERIMFRWNMITDPEKPTGFPNCSSSDGGLSYTGSCLGNIEYLKLSGTDKGLSHDSSADLTLYDGVIDTWEIHKDFADGNIAAGSNNENYWVPLFPSNIHVSDFQVFAYPNRDIDLNWKDINEDMNISPYVRIQLKLLPSWKVKKQLKGQNQELIFSTTISLTDIFSY